MPKLAVTLICLAALAWIVAPLGSPPRSLLQDGGSPAAILVAIPVGLGVWGLFSERHRRVAGVALLVFSLVVFLISVWMIGLSYLPSAILLLIGKRAEGCSLAHSLHEI